VSALGRKVEKLAAEISVQDKASKKLDAITKSMTKQNNELLRMKASMEKLRSQANKKTDMKVNTKKAENDVSRLDRAFRGLQNTIRGVGSAMHGLGGMASRFLPGPGSLLLGGAAVAGGGYGAKQTFDNTFLKSAQYEMSEKTIQAMFNNKKKSELYMKQMEQMAIGSPLLNSQEIFGNSKSFIALSKDQKQLDQMWDLAERLLAVDPAQGVSGAIFALRELFSGDARSMAERFELSKKVLKDIKDLPLEKQLKELDKYFNKMGMTKHLVNEMGDTTLGVWNQIKETTEVGLRRIGDPAVKIVKPMLDDLNKSLQEGKLNPYIKFGQDMASGIAEGFVKTAKDAGKWIDGIINDPEFKQKKDMLGKVEFVFGDIYNRFEEWLNTGGKDRITNITSDIISTMSEAVAKSEGPIIEMGASIGTALGKGIVDGVTNHLKDKFLNLDFGPVGFGKDIANKYLGGYLDNSKKIWGIGDGKVKPEEKQGYTPTYKYAEQPKSHKRAFGMQRVPYNNYPALLHEGEKVLTKQQANQQKQGITAIIKDNTFVVREEADIDKIVNLLVRKLDEGRVVFGGES
jgi:hypothetical protein